MVIPALKALSGKVKQATQLLGSEAAKQLSNRPAFEGEGIMALIAIQQKTLGLIADCIDETCQELEAKAPTP